MMMFCFEILVAIRGEMKKAFIVGCNTHVRFRKHGIPATDTTNIVLLVSAIPATTEIYRILT